MIGVAANAPVGNMPDAMTYRLNEIYPGCYVSLADVLTAYVVSKGQALEVPGQATKTIVNVVPFYDDERIHRFLRKYAPKMQEYVASVGMRRWTQTHAAQRARASCAHPLLAHCSPPVSLLCSLFAQAAWLPRCP